MLHIIWSIIIGFIIGLISRAIMPGVQHLGFVAARFFVSPRRSYHVDYWRTHLALHLG